MTKSKRKGRPAEEIELGCRSCKNGRPCEEGALLKEELRTASDLHQLQNTTRRRLKHRGAQKALRDHVEGLVAVVDIVVPDFAAGFIETTEA